MNVDKEFPAIPVNLRSGLTQRLMFLPSKNTYILVFGFILPTLNLMGTLLANSDNDVDTKLPFIVLVCTPLPTSLFCGLILDVLPTDAVCTDVLAICEFTPPRELMLVNDEEAPTQFTINELWILEKLSFTFSFAKKILNRSVFVSTTTGSIDWSYHWSTDGDTWLSPTYWSTTNGFGFSVEEAKSFPNKDKDWYGRVIICPDFLYPATALWSSLVLTSIKPTESSFDCGRNTDCWASTAQR